MYLVGVEMGVDIFMMTGVWLIRLTMGVGVGIDVVLMIPGCTLVAVVDVVFFSVIKKQLYKF